MDSAILFTDENFDVTDRVFWNNDLSKDGSVTFLGDTVNG